MYYKQVKSSKEIIQDKIIFKDLIFHIINIFHHKKARFQVVKKVQEIGCKRIWRSKDIYQLL